MGPRPKPDEARPPTIQSPARAGTRPISGRPSSENGMRPAQVRTAGWAARKGRTSTAWPWFTSMPAGSGARSTGELPVPAEDDLAILPLSPVEMARDAGAVAMREIRRLVLTPVARGQAPPRSSCQASPDSADEIV